MFLNQIFSPHFYKTYSILFLILGSIFCLLLSKKNRYIKKIHFLSLLFNLSTLTIGSYHLFSNITHFNSILINTIALLISFATLQHHSHKYFFSSKNSALYLLTVAGLIILNNSENFISYLLGLEISSLGTYILIGYTQTRKKSIEGVIKSLILGFMSTIFVLLSFVLISKSLNTIWLKDLAMNAEGLVNSLWCEIGLVFLLCGLACKLALCPFHMWAVDMIEGGFSPIVAFFASSFIFTLTISLTKFLSFILTIDSDHFVIIFSNLSLLSLIIPNIQALIQTSIKRIIAYTSISQNAISISLFCSFTSSSHSSQFFLILISHLIVNTISTLAIYIIIIHCERDDKIDLQIKDLKGYWYSKPLITIALGSALLSQIGIPPFIGFINKFYILSFLLNSNLYIHFICICIGSFLSLLCYLNIISFLFSTSDKNENNTHSKKSLFLNFYLSFTLIFLLFGTFFILYGDKLIVLNNIGNFF